MKRKPATHAWRHADPGAAQRHLCPLPADRTPPWLFIAQPARNGEYVRGLLVSSVPRRDLLTNAVEATVNRVVGWIEADSQRRENIWIDTQTGTIRPADVPSDASWINGRLRDFKAFDITCKVGLQRATPHALPPPPTLIGAFHGKPLTERQRARHRETAALRKAARQAARLADAAN